MSVFFCPNCEFPLTGFSKVNRTPGQLDAAVYCSNCEAILRVEILTLKDPKLDFRKNQAQPNRPNKQPVVQQTNVCPHGKTITDPRYPSLSGNCPSCRGAIVGQNV